MTAGPYLLHCACGRNFVTLCPAPADCPHCAATRLLSRPVAYVETASERAFYDAEYEPEAEPEIAETEYSEFGAEPLPEEEDAAVTALLTGRIPPRRLGVGGLEICIGVMLCIVGVLIAVTGGFR